MRQIKLASFKSAASYSLNNNREIDLTVDRTIENRMQLWCKGTRASVHVRKDGGRYERLPRVRIIISKHYPR